MNAGQATGHQQPEAGSACVGDCDGADRPPTAGGKPQPEAQLGGKLSVM